MKFESKIFNLNFKNSVGFLTFKGLEGIPFIRHAFSTRVGGVSNGCFKSMNLSFSVGDKRENVIANYHCLCDALEIEYSSLVASAQDHNTFIRVVTQKDKGVGISRERDIESVDGLLTNEKGITLVTYYADCVPLFFVDTVKKVIGLAHAGWRGTQKLIAEKMIKKMHDTYQSSTQDIKVGIAPSIMQCCYEVDENLIDKFKQTGRFEMNDLVRKNERGRFMLDLQGANKQLLLQSGVLKENIYVTDMCTKCCSDLLISHRATNGKRGVMGALLQLKE